MRSAGRFIIICAMADLLFGQSYFLRFDPKLWEAMQPYPPLGTLYAASYVKQAGYSVALFDAMLAESEDEWAAELDREQPRFAVLYEDNFNYLSKMCLLRMREAAFTMIHMARERGCTVIVSGADATDHAALYLDAGADYVLLGEGEETLCELADMLEGRLSIALDDIPGLAFRRDGQVCDTGRRPLLKHLDALPFPAWELVDVERYRRIWLEQHGYFSMNMVTTRGCPYHCNWCAKPIWGQRYHSRSPQNVAEEMRWLTQTYHPDHIWFADDIMGLQPGWWEAFADAVETHNTRIPFKCLSRADLIVREGDNVEVLWRAGCQIVWIGAESGSQKILDAMEKGTTVEQIHEAARRLHAAGIRVGFFLQFGYPVETREDIEQTLQLVRDCKPDDIGISVSYPLPGTKFYENVRMQLGNQQNWIDSADLAMLYQGPFTTAFYRQLHTVVHKEFRARQTLPQSGWRRLLPLRQIGRVLYHLLTLPAARRKLNRLARVPHAGLKPMPHMPRHEAATPSQQV